MDKIGFSAYDYFVGTGCYLLSVCFFVKKHAKNFWARCALWTGLGLLLVWYYRIYFIL